MSEKADNYKKYRGFGLFGLIFFLFMWYIVAANEKFMFITKRIGINDNLFVYFLSILISLLFVLLNWLIKPVIIKKETSKKIHIIFVVGCFCVVGIIINWFIQSYFFENSSFGIVAGYQIRHIISHNVWILWLFVCGMLIYHSVDWMKSSNDKQRMYIALVASSIYFALIYAPDFLGDKAGTVQHSHAYVNSIINVAYGTPFSDVSLSVYGFYGIIYYPFVKLFGSDYNAIAISIALFGFVICFAACYIASKMIKRDIVYLLCVLGIIGSVSTIYVSGQYFQGIPHRLFFPVIIMAYVVHRYKKHMLNDGIKIVNSIIDITILALAVMWNLEMGICCCFVLMSYYFILLIYKLRLNRTDRKSIVIEVIKYTVFALGIVVLSIAFSYLLICSYNIITGGSFISLKRFIYPFCSDIYPIENLYAPLQSVYREYWIHIVIYIGLIWWTLTSFNEDGVLLVVLSASGLTSLTYFMNRAAGGNLSVARIQLIIALGIMVEYGIMEKALNFKDQMVHIIKNAEQTLKWSIGLVGYILLFYFAADSFLMTGTSLYIKSNRQFDMKTYESIVMLDIINSLPKEKMVAVGIGASDMLYTFGIDTNLHIGDFSDPFTDEGIEYMYNKIAEAEYLFVTTDVRWGGLNEDVLNEFEEIGNSGHAIIYRRIGVDK